MNLSLKTFAPLLIVLNLAYGALPPPMVITKYGAVVGSSQITEDGTVINEFLGIPFAQPPVGKLRWEVKIEKRTKVQISV